MTRIFFAEARHRGAKGTWRSVCSVPLGNAALGGWGEVHAKVGATLGQGHEAWTGAKHKEHGFQFKPQGTGSGKTRAWVWQTSDESADQYLPGFGAMWLDRDGQLWIPAGQALPEGEVRAGGCQGTQRDARCPNTGRPVCCE